MQMAVQTAWSSRYHGLFLVIAMALGCPLDSEASRAEAAYVYGGHEIVPYRRIFSSATTSTSTVE